jgi:hypothetical protein
MHDCSNNAGKSLATNFAVKSSSLDETKNSTASLK